MSEALDVVVEGLKAILALVVIGALGGWAFGQLERLAGWRRR